MTKTLRGIPAAHRLLADPRVARRAGVLGAPAVKAAVDDALARARTRALGGEEPSFERLVADVSGRLDAAAAAALHPVLNGTGILLHTNLGRAPLAAEAAAAMREAAAGYTNLEVDLQSGARDSRQDRVAALLRDATGAEDGIVVNNCAAAVLLILDAFARGRDVVVSRGELVEIGGGFRVPDVLARSGARLVEVGTTNKTHLRDFERALTADTALVLRTHPSNYRIEGFTADVAARDLVALGRRTGVAVVEDLGSGALVDLAAYGAAHERTVQEAVADGIDLVAFSGDKLLGGPQAGIVVGRAAPIARLRATPLLRALRPDKATLAALAATLRLYLQPGGADRIPLYAMLRATPDALRERARGIADALRPLAESAEPAATTAYVGGGALPQSGVASFGVAVLPADGNPNALAARLRRGDPPLVARADGSVVVVDLRAIPPERDRDVVAVFERALRA